MRKSLLILLVAFAFLTACGNDVPVVTDVPETQEPQVITVVVTAPPLPATEEPTEVLPTEEPTALPTEEPTATVDPNAWRYKCGKATMEKPVYQKSYRNSNGALRVNAQGHWILKPVPRTEVLHYFPGDTICFYFDPFQVDNMRVVQVTTTRGSGFFFPIALIDFVK